MALLACFLVFWRFRKTWGRPFLAGLGYYVLTLLPVLGFLNIFFMLYSLVADHWQYTPILGVIALVVGLAAHAVTRHPNTLRRPGVVVAIIVVCGLAGLSASQQSIYANSTALWQDTLAKNPKAWMADLNLGNILHEQGRRKEAMDHYLKALAEQPTDAAVHYNLARALEAEARIPKAIEHYRKAIALDPTEWRSFINLGNVLLEQGQSNEALDCYRKAVDANPYESDAHYNLGRAYLARKQYEQARFSLVEALKLKPSDPDTHLCMGRALIGLQQWPLAVTHLQEALAFEPNLPPAHANLGLALLRAGQGGQAIPHLLAALNTMPNDAELHHCLALALAGQGQIPQAVEQGLVALKLNSDSADILADLAWLIATHEITRPPDWPKPVPLAERACELTQRDQPRLLDILAAAYADAGRYAEAAATAREAIARANATGQSALATEISKRITFYASSQPWREPLQDPNPPSPLPIRTLTPHPAFSDPSGMGQLVSPCPPNCLLRTPSSPAPPCQPRILLGII